MPDSLYWLGIFNNALLTTVDAWRWEQVNDTDLTVEEAVAKCQEIINQYWLISTCDTGVMPTPFWDEAIDLDDQLPDDAQPWYGYVTDPDAPADELEFIESAAIWAITGFIAYAGEIGGAIFFNTVAPRFVLAWKRGDIGEVIRVVIDAADYGTVDTGTVGIGEIIELNVLPAEELATHDITLIKVG